MGDTVYVRPRAIRTAFVIDTSVFHNGTWSCDALLDGIVSGALHTWGGRRNPVILIKPNEDLSADQWLELETADPDRVQAFAPLADEWVERFHNRLLPWSMEVEDKSREAPTQESPEASWRGTHLRLPGIATPPSPQNLKKLRSEPLLMVEFSPDCPLEFRRFFHRNFGTYEQWFDHRSNAARRIAWLEHTLANVETETVRVSDLDSVCAALDSFAGSFLPPKPRQPLRFIAPVELSALHLSAGIPRDPYSHAYRVFVGDSADDFVAYWNELRICGCWAAPHNHSLWLPAGLARQSLFVESLRGFLHQYSRQHSSDGLTVELTSETLSARELETISSQLRAGRSGCRVNVIDAPTRRTRLHERLRDEVAGSRPQPTLNGLNAQRLRISERTETLTTAEPDALVGDGEWAVDVQIEFGASNRFQQPRWWCLPRNSGTELARTIFRAPARVARSHLFAVAVGRINAVGNQKTPDLHIALPEEVGLVARLITGTHSGFDYGDVRREQLHQRERVADIKISDKGQNLRGLIEAFGSFWTARDFCERQFWREALAMLAGQDARRRGKLAEQTGNVVRKALHGLGKQDDIEQRTEHVVSKILPWVHGALEDEPLSRADLTTLLQQMSADQAPEKEISYLSGNTIVHQQGVTPLTEQEMIQGLNQLLARNILRTGMIVRCQHCGIESWFHIDEIKQFNECSSCGNVRPLRVDSEWHYRLNSLAKRCVSARVLAVLQALISVAGQSMGSFFYSPNLEIYRSPSETSWRELDVACVSDGKLVIGEVKDGAFNKTELDRFADAAEFIRPDRAAIFIPHDRFDAKAQHWFSELNKRLAVSGITAEIHQLPAL